MSPHEKSRVRPRHGFRRAVLLAVLAFTWTAGVWAAEDGEFLTKPRAAYEAKLALMQDKYLGRGFEATSNQYCTLLSGQADAARARGDLRGHLAARRELERFQAAGAVTEQDIVAGNPAVADIQRSFMAAYAARRDRLHQEEAQLTAAYLRYLENTESALTRENRINDALRVAAEIESVQATVNPGLPAPAAPPAAEPAPPPAAEQPIPEDRFIVIVADEKGPVSGLNVTLQSQSFGQLLARKTDHKGQAEFTITPELAYFIRIVDPRYEPFFQPDCVGGTSREVALQPMPTGVQVIEMGIAGHFQLPGISPIRISGSYGSRVGAGLTLETSSPYTAFAGQEPGTSTFRLDFGTWTTVSERARRVELKALTSPDNNARFILYREVPPDPATPPPAAGTSSLTVLVKDATHPLPAVEVALISLADGRRLTSKTKRDGRAVFAVQPELEYFVLIADPHHEPFVQTHCIGGQSIVAVLPPLPRNAHMILPGAQNEFQLPGISPMSIYGYSGNFREVVAVLVKLTSSRTTVAGQAPAQDRVEFKANQWTLVTENKRRVEMMMVAAPDGARIVYYRPAP